MEDGLKRMTTTPRAKSARPFVIRSKQWTLSVGRPDSSAFKVRKEAMSAISL